MKHASWGRRSEQKTADVQREVPDKGKLLRRAGVASRKQTLWKSTDKVFSKYKLHRDRDDAGHGQHERLRAVQ